MNFTKMQGLGNDFVVIDGPFELSSAVIAALCDRRRGVGADGVLIVSPDSRNRVAMEYFNADGSAAEMCGNGLRCVARRAVDQNLVDGWDFVVSTAIGPRRVSILDGGRIRVELGPVEAARADQEVDGHTLRTVRVGNPHAVIFVEDPAAVDVQGIGSQLEQHPVFPEGTNVEFVSVVSADVIDMRVWERGVGETLACGTGAAAVVAAGAATGRSAATARVRLPGGHLDVEVADGVAWITGPATTVFSGVWPG
ncbi:MAG: diaminopimelate epimerase [Acidimicrobiia bacterium]|nr:diaminopimelate epimerase [Acidimicrobiia bacterium]